MFSHPATPMCFGPRFSDYEGSSGKGTYGSRSSPRDIGEHTTDRLNLPQRSGTAEISIGTQLTISVVTCFGWKPKTDDGEGAPEPSFPPVSHKLPKHYMVGEKRGCRENVRRATNAQWKSGRTGRSPADDKHDNRDCNKYIDNFSHSAGSSEDTKTDVESGIAIRTG